MTTLTLPPATDAFFLGDQAYNAIKEGILSLRFQPGQLIAIGDLAQELAISRTPVREALQRLAQEGLVTIVPFKGALVSTISSDDIREIFELRIILESYAAKVAATVLTDEEIEQAERYVSQAREAFLQGDLMGASDLGRRLHDILVAKVKNRRLMAMLEGLNVQYTRIRRYSANIPNRLERSHKQHLEILDALKARDAHRAESLMRHHLQTVCQDVIAAMDEITNQSKA